MPTAEYFAIPAPVPCSVAVFRCACGAEAVECDPKQITPPGWATFPDGSARCPRCAGSSEAERQPD